MDIGWNAHHLGELMRRLIKKLLYAIVICEGLALFVLGFLAYFTRSRDVQANLWRDGLGRPLVDTPLIARFFFGADSQWAGWSQFVLEMMFFWGGIGVGYLLIQLAERVHSDADATHSALNW